MPTIDELLDVTPETFRDSETLEGPASVSFVGCSQSTEDELVDMCQRRSITLGEDAP